jgi:hypothetical protein
VIRNCFREGHFLKKKCAVRLPPHSQKQPVWHIYHEKKQGVKEGMALVRKNVGNLGERTALKGKKKKTKRFHTTCRLAFTSSPVHSMVIQGSS